MEKPKAILTQKLRLANGAQLTFYESGPSEITGTRENLFPLGSGNYTNPNAVAVAHLLMQAHERMDDHA